MIDYLRGHGEVFLVLLAAVMAVLWGISRIFPPMSAAQQVILAAMIILWTAGFAWCVFKTKFPFFSRHKVEIAIILLVLYVISLALITVSELFDLNWFSWL